MVAKRGDDGCHHGWIVLFPSGGEEECAIARQDMEIITMQGHFLMLSRCPCIAIIAI